MSRQQPEGDRGLNPDDPLAQRLARARAEVAAAEAAVARAEERLRDFSAVALSEDGAVEATVGAQGELTGLRFLHGKYRDMTGTELGAAVVEAVRQGRDRAAQEAVRVFRPLTGPTERVPELSGLDVDWERFLSRHDDAPGRPARPRPSAGSRLRDEIHEDGEHDTEGPQR
ncbi:YbaB/EbfC family nucleoid-associated protein [Streptomyces sp. NBC_00670]|uniref:YbaB/EbfC family nucleoid-associated protein n=1 Tax=Streptomyces sp. NBC_00670 TaxID=2975804 RepID=UPI002E305752|nr:YbaB/EbfC family nucleoid-associated protein [Streptomyces sp. NBC_00670]